MDIGTLLNLSLVLLFVLIGGVFAATEMALVTLRESQLRQLERGSSAGRTVARLARDSGTFLSAVQIGVTVMGFLSSAYGASTIAPDLAPGLEALGLGPGIARTVALVGMTLVVSYLSLVLGELVPKRMALQAATRIATITAPPLSAFASLMRPVIWLLEVSTSGVLRLLRFDPSVTDEAMSDDEVRDIVSSHTGFDADERTMMRDVFAASDRLIREVMQHRSDMEALQQDTPIEEAALAVGGLSHSRYPVYAESVDEVTGFVHVRDLLLARSDPGQADQPVSSLAREMAVLPGTSSLIPAMTTMRQGGHHIALVVDEYGGTDGLVTLEDLLEELVGEIWDEYDAATERTELGLDESQSFDGQTNLEDFAELTGIGLPEGPYETVAGWVLVRLGRVAREGDRVAVPPELSADPEDDEDEHEGSEQDTDVSGSTAVRYQLVVAEVDRHRITRLTLRKVRREVLEERDDTMSQTGPAPRTPQGGQDQ